MRCPTHASTATRGHPQPRATAPSAVLLVVGRFNERTTRGTTSVWYCRWLNGVPVRWLEVRLHARQRKKR